MLHFALSLSLQSVDTVCTLYQSFQDGPAAEAKGTVVAAAAASGQGSGSGPGADTAGTATLLRPCQRHMSPTERLRKVIQELVDTEKSYVKVIVCVDISGILTILSKATKYICPKSVKQQYI